MKKFLLTVFALVLLLGCEKKDQQETTSVDNTVSGNSGDSGNSNEVVVLKIPHYKANPDNIGNVFFSEIVDEYNAMHEGKYRIEAEVIPQKSYEEKIQQLGQQGALPPIVEGAMKEQFIERGWHTDLTDWLNANPEIKDVLVQGSVDFNTINGEIVTLPKVTIRPVGLYYNSALIQPDKPIHDMTVDEYIAMIQDNNLLISGQTVENAWTSVLQFSVFLANEPGGREILDYAFIPESNRTTNLNNPAMINALTKLQDIVQNHANSDIMGADYPDAANAFLSNQTAIIHNGPWMMGEFRSDSGKWSNGFDGNNVMVDFPPGNISFGSTNGYGWWVPSTVTDGEREGALAFFELLYSRKYLEKFALFEGGVLPNMEVSDDYKAQLAEDRIGNLYAQNLNPENEMFPVFVDIVPRSVGFDLFGKLLLQLIDGTITPEDMAAQLEQGAIEAME